MTTTRRTRRAARIRRERIATAALLLCWGLIGLSVAGTLILWAAAYGQLLAS